MVNGKRAVSDIRDDIENNDKKDTFIYCVLVNEIGDVEDMLIIYCVQIKENDNIRN